LSDLIWDCDEDLVVFTLSHISSVLNRFLAGELSAEEVHEWCDAIECREDIGFDEWEEALVKKFIYENANPDLFPALDVHSARKWVELLRDSNSPI
jgi:hypothetical protein